MNIITFYMINNLGGQVTFGENFLKSFYFQKKILIPHLFRWSFRKKVVSKVLTFLTGQTIRKYNPKN